MSINILKAAKRLSLHERLELIDALWESVMAEGYDLPLTDAQAQEIDQRLKAHECDPKDVVHWKPQE